uniref:Uncharacterized protein n=1 Tax=Rhizophora mucronata TaxID=61149 RepID=A0A2P2PTL7_RHIMU
MAFLVQSASPLYHPHFSHIGLVKARISLTQGEEIRRIGG